MNLIPNVHITYRSDSAQLLLAPLELNQPGFRSFLCTWILLTPEATVLIDCGVAGTYPALRRALASVARTFPDAHAPTLLLLTHIHLDHSGAVGLLARDYPDLRVYCWERAAKHLISPAKLWHATSATLGPEMAAAYGEPLPLPADRMVSRNELPPGWTVIDTPGHAPHHVSFIHGIGDIRVCFGGEACGTISGRESAEWFTDSVVREGIRPATPPRYIPEVGRASIEKLAAADWDLYCAAHYGSTTDRNLPTRALAQLDLWEKSIARWLGEGLTEDDMIASLLDVDPELANIRHYTDGDRTRETYFMRNSVRGFIGYLTARA